MIWKIRNFRCSTIVFLRLTILSSFQMMRWCCFVHSPGLICFNHSPGLICGELGARHPCVELQPNLAGNSDSFDLCLSSVVQNSQIWHFQRFSTFSPFYFNFLKKSSPCPPCHWYSRRCAARFQSSSRGTNLDYYKDKDKYKHNIWQTWFGQTYCLLLRLLSSRLCAQRFNNYHLEFL